MAQQQDDLTANLMELFPPPSSSHIRWRANDANGKKSTITVGRAANYEAYAGHLAPSSMVGPGGVGIPLSAQSTTGNWESRAAALDIDSLTVEELRDSPVLDTLESYGIHTYLTTGSTGRGSHVLALLDQEVPTEHVHAALEGMRTLVRQSFPGQSIELFPSNPNGKGNSLYLPYRGAELNGYGANAILDPTKGLAPIALSAAPSHLRRTLVEDFVTLAGLADEEQPFGPEAASPHIQPAEDAHTALLREVERLRPLARPGNRNFLTKGFTAYGIAGLRLPPTTVRAQVREMLVQAGPEGLSREAEIKPFLADAARTINRFLNGLPVAWYLYYKHAGVQPPTVGRSPELAKRTHNLLTRTKNLEFSGRTGTTDQALYEALVQLTLRFGRLHEEGILVQVSRRALALHANLGDSGAKNSLRRLEDRKLLKRQPHLRMSAEAGTILLYVPSHEPKQQPHSSPSTSNTPLPEREWVRCFGDAAFRRGALGNLAALVTCQLKKADASLTIREIAKNLKRDVYQLKGAIAKLVEHSIVIEDPPGTLSLTDDYQAQLDLAAETTGANSTREKQRARHELERQEFHEFRERMAKRAPRGVERDPATSVFMPTSKSDPGSS